MKGVHSCIKKVMLHTRNSTSNIPIVVIYDCTKTTVKTTYLSNYISDMHFEGEPPNLMTANFPHYTVCH